MTKMTTETTETVTLLRDHLHRGIVRPAGSQITVRPDQRQRLERNGYVEPRNPYPRGPGDVQPTAE